MESNLSSKVSVVIPTMWKSPRIHQMLRKYQECDWVHEIILVDNAYDQRTGDVSKYSKLRTLEYGENIYVNLAWNRGVEEAVAKHVLIANDDIAFQPKVVIPAMLARLDYGAVGIHPKSINAKNLWRAQARDGTRTHGWGILMMVSRSRWIPIPEEMKIWCGDDWIAATHGKPQSCICNIYTEMSTTSGVRTYSAIKNQDLAQWNQKYKRQAMNLTKLDSVKKP